MIGTQWLGKGNVFGFEAGARRFYVRFSTRENERRKKKKGRKKRRKVNKTFQILVILRNGYRIIRTNFNFFLEKSRTKLSLTTKYFFTVLTGQTILKYFFCKSWMLTWINMQEYFSSTFKKMTTNQLNGYCLWST